MFSPIHGMITEFQKTHAYHKLTDDVPEDVKAQRHAELSNAFREEAHAINLSQVGKTHLVLVEGVRAYNLAILTLALHTALL